MNYLIQRRKGKNDFKFKSKNIDWVKSSKIDFF